MPLAHKQISILARLTPAKVRKIRQLALQGVRQVELARRFKVSQPAISMLLRGVTYRTVVD